MTKISNKQMGFVFGTLILGAILIKTVVGTAPQPAPLTAPVQAEPKQLLKVLGTELYSLCDNISSEADNSKIFFQIKASSMSLVMTFMPNVLVVAKRLVFLRATVLVIFVTVIILKQPKSKKLVQWT